MMDIDFDEEYKKFEARVKQERKRLLAQRPSHEEAILECHNLRPLNKPPQTLAAVKRKYILRTLLFFNGNRCRTAHYLQISIRTLRNNITEYQKLGIPVIEGAPHGHPAKEKE